MNFFRPLVALTLAAGIAAPALAHHGKDFLLTQTAILPDPGAVYGIARQDYIDAGEDELELEPALNAGVTDWLALELHGHVAKPDHESWNHESTAAEVDLRFTPRGSALALGASLEYAVSADNEENDVLGATAIVGYDAGAWQYALNLLMEDEMDADHTRWGYAAGARYSVRHHHALGLELMHAPDSEEGGTELLAGYYFESHGPLGLNLGVGTGIDDGPDWTLRTALIWRFR